LDTLEDLSQEEIRALDDWESLFRSKYLLCGSLVDDVSNIDQQLL